MKKKMTPLNKEQQKLVEDNLAVVHKAIHKYIIVNETVFGFAYDDLFQEGCIWLCKAATTYQDAKAVKFETYAFKVVSNGLRTYCRLMCSKQKKQYTIPLCSDDEDNPFALDKLPAEDVFEDMLAEIDILQMLEIMKQQYSGTTRLGIEAIEWKIKGFSGREIADLYGVKANLVGAWISRAAKKLKENQQFMTMIEEYVEKMPP